MNRVQFWRLQKVVRKKIKGAQTMKASNGQYYVADKEGKNVIGNKYPDLALADDVITAWKRVSIVEHWNRMEARQVKGIRKDIQNNTVQGGEELSKAIYEYFEDEPGLYDEENRNE